MWHFVLIWKKILFVSVSYLCITNSNKIQQHITVSICLAHVHFDQMIWVGLCVVVLLCLGPMFSPCSGDLCTPPTCLSDQFYQCRYFHLNFPCSHHYHLYPCFVLNLPLGPIDFSSLVLDFFFSTSLPLSLFYLIISHLI